MNFLNVIKYDYEEKLYGNRPDYTFERMILRQLETIIKCESIVIYLITNDFEGLKKELSQYGEVDLFFKELSDEEHRNSNVASIQLKMLDYFKKYICITDLSPEDIIKKSSIFTTWIINKDRLCFFEKTPSEIENINKLDEIELKLNEFIKERLIQIKNKHKM